MYTVNKGPSKLVAKTRGGLSQNFEKIETIREISRKCSENFDNQEMMGPRPVFQQTRKTYHNHHHHHHQKDHTIDEPTSPQHEELVKYIRDSWNMVVSANPYDNGDSDVVSGGATNLVDGDMANGNKATSTNQQSTQEYVVRRGTIYHDDPPSPILKDFGAFDLESWWGRRLFNNITKSL